MYLLPALHQDARTIFQTVQEKYEYKYTQQIEDTAIELTGGHMQYLYLLHIILYEKLKKQTLEKLSQNTIKSWVLEDEQVKLLSEEIFEGLSKSEQETVKNLTSGKKVTQTRDNKYLFDTGIIKDNSFFSPLFEDYLQKKTQNTETIEFSKKEHLLYTHLLQNSGEICERDAIIHAVWPESEETGVSDWTIDRLVARLRHKLGLQKSDQKIVTVKTRGYKLVQS
jgi:DNA-binding winged helix-turn-helix (wHTH) protein